MLNISLLYLVLNLLISTHNLCNNSLILPDNLRGRLLRLTCCCAWQGLRQSRVGCRTSSSLGFCCVDPWAQDRPTWDQPFCMPLKLCLCIPWAFLPFWQMPTPGQKSSSYKEAFPPSKFASFVLLYGCSLAVSACACPAMSQAVLRTLLHCLCYHCPLDIRPSTVAKKAI